MDNFGVMRSDLELRIMENRLNELRQVASTSKNKEDQDPKVREAARMFESYFIEYLLQCMQQSVNAWKDDDSSSNNRDIYFSMIYRNLADRLAESGGIGIARLIEQHISTNSTTTTKGGNSLSPAPNIPSATPSTPGFQATPPAAAPVQGANGVNLSGAIQQQLGSGLQQILDQRVTSSYGWRSDPFTGQSAFHKGIDIAMRPGTPVESVATGVVEWAGPQEGSGNTVIVRHPGNIQSIYGHLSEIQVQPGNSVQKGTLLGRSGDTGRSTGPHLHFEVHADGKAVDPEKLAKIFSRF